MNKESFRVYAYNKGLAKDTFINACNKYSKTDNEHYQQYWNDLAKYTRSEDYTIIENKDFIGVRKVF